MLEISFEKTVLLAKMTKIIALCSALTLVILDYLKPFPILILFFFALFILRSMLSLAIISATEDNRQKFWFRLETFIFIAVGIQGFLVGLSDERFYSAGWFFATMFLVGLANPILRECFLVNLTSRAN